MNAKDIAGRLTKAQRDALCKQPWSMMAQYEAGLSEPLSLGLLAKDAYGHCLTPLGLAVREAIMQEEG